LTTIITDGPLAAAALKRMGDDAERYMRRIDDSTLFLTRKFPVKYILTGCIDGRGNPAHYLGLPDGVVSVYRNRGRIHWGSPGLAQLIMDEVGTALANDQVVVVINTYHGASGGDTEHSKFGCKAYGFNPQKAAASTWDQTQQLARWYAHRSNFFSIMAGLDTDTGQVRFHGDDPSQVLLTGTLSDKAAQESIVARLAQLYFRMAANYPLGVSDLAQRVRGNLSYIRDYPVDDSVILRSHNEKYLGFGRGLFFFPLNTAIIIGPYGMDVPEDIRIGCDVLDGNYKNGILAQDEPWCLVASTLCAGLGEEFEHAAADQARDYLGIVLKVIQSHAPDLLHPREQLVGYFRQDLTFVKVSAHPPKTSVKFEVDW
jgi:hypothetical protein